jgi:hypothetical protein
MSPGRRRAVLLAMCLAVIVVVASMSSLNLALPGIGRDLGASQSELQWMVDGYTLFLAALVLPAGALGDRFGRQRLMVVGLAVLIGTFLYGSMADSPLQVVLSRMLGGVGAALVFPGTLSTITAVMPSDRRGKAIGLWAAVGGEGDDAHAAVMGVGPAEGEAPVVEGGDLAGHGGAVEAEGDGELVDGGGTGPLQGPQQQVAGSVELSVELGAAALLFEGAGQDGQLGFDDVEGVAAVVVVGAGVCA